MHRHGPHILSIVKNALLAVALYAAVRAGLAGSLHAALGNLFYGSSWAVIPAYWLVIMLGAFLLTFPLTLTQDHWSRAAEGLEEETPASFWMRNLAVEATAGTLIGCATTALLHRWPETWWLAWAVLWNAYHLVASRAQEFHTLAEEDEEDLPTHPELVEVLNPLVKPAQLTITQVYELPEPDEDWPGHDDLLLRASHGTTAIYLPSDWIRWWNPDELAAVILHKAWLTRQRLAFADIGVNLVITLACFGLFAVLPISTTPVLKATLLFAWSVVALPALQIPALTYFRRTMILADEAVSRQMGTPDPLIRVLERASRNAPTDAETPVWAERLFFNTPTLARRLERIRRHHPAGCP